MRRERSNVSSATDLSATREASDSVLRRSMFIRNQLLKQSEGRVQKLGKTWEREDAEQRIVEVLDAARSGAMQTIRDSDGVFELTFKAVVKKMPAGRYLARGGPIKR